MGIATGVSDGAAVAAVATVAVGGVVAVAIAVVVLVAVTVGANSVAVDGGTATSGDDGGAQLANATSIRHVSSKRRNLVRRRCVEYVTISAAARCGCMS